MKQTALLSGYVFQWNMKKGGWAVYVFSILAGVITAVYRGYAGMAGETSPYRAKGFLPYELIIDQSMIPLFFGIGLLALLFLQFLQLRKYQKESKGIYTFLTLPMKGTQVANAFLLQSLAMVFLYYALWLMVIVVMYFPMMHWMVSLAAKQEFLMDDGTILTGIDATRHNGLFLAFLRSEFLDVVYSLNWKNLLLGLFLLFYLSVGVVSISMQRAVGLTGIFVCVMGLMIPLALYLQGNSAGEVRDTLFFGGFLLPVVGIWLIFRLQADFREPLAK